MTYYLEALMFALFVLVALIWLIQISKQKSEFSLSEKCRAVTFGLGFFVGMALNLTMEHILTGFICMVGVVISEFLIAVIFYENFKDKEIVDE